MRKNGDAYSILIESAKRIVVVQLVVEAEAAFKEWIVSLVPLLVGNHPECVSKDGLLKVASLPPFVVSSKEIGKQFQLSCAEGQVDTLVVCKAMSLTTP